MKLYKDWLLRRQIKQSIRILQKVDKTMKVLGMPRWKRKQMWRDFIKSESQRNNIMDLLNGAKP